MQGITFNFINNADITSDTRIVIFQKKGQAGSGDVVAWKVIKNCGKGWHHPFVYPIQSFISVLDCWGNYSPLIAAEEGQQFTVKLDASGSTLEVADSGEKQKGIAVMNTLEGVITVGVYKNGSLFTPKLSLHPGTVTVFAFEPTIWLGVAQQVEEGDIIDPALVDKATVEISLLGLVSADIVLTGGGSGDDAKPLQFTLENQSNG